MVRSQSRCGPARGHHPNGLYRLVRNACGRSCFSEATGEGFDGSQPTAASVPLAVPSARFHDSTAELVLSGDRFGRRIGRAPLSTRPIVLIGQYETERGAAIGRRFCPDTTAVAADDAGDRGEADPGPFVFAPGV